MWDDISLNCSRNLKSLEEKGIGEVTLRAHASSMPFYKRSEGGWGPEGILDGWRGWRRSPPGLRTLRLALSRARQLARDHTWGFAG